MTGIAGGAQAYDVVPMGRDRLNSKPKTGSEAIT